MHRAPDAISNAIGCAKFYSRSHDAVIRVYDEGGNVIDTHERASPYLSAVFGPDGTMSFWKRESVRRGSDQYIFRDTTKSRGCAMVTKPSGTEYGDMKIRRLDRRRASGAAASVARHELEALDFAMSSSTTTVLKTLAKHVAAHLGERAFCVVFEDDLERCWPSARLERAIREKEIQSFAGSQGWGAVILTGDFGIRAIFRKLEPSFADYEGSSVVPI